MSNYRTLYDKDTGNVTYEKIGKVFCPACGRINSASEMYCVECCNILEEN